MAKQTIQVGAAANDGTGDTLRNAMIKIVANTTELYNDVANVGIQEGTAVKSTGETGAVKFLRENGDGTSSWQLVAGTVTANVTASNNFSEYSATLTAARAGLGLSYGTTSGTVCDGADSRLSDARTPTTHNHDADYATTVQGDRADTALQSADIGSAVQGYAAVLSATTAAFTATIATEVTTLRTDLNVAAALIAVITPTVRTTTVSGLTTDADFGVTVLMAEGHTIALHPVTDAARLGQSITFRLRGTTQQPISAGTATTEGPDIITQHDEMTAKLLEVGAGTLTVWGLTGGSAA